MVKSLKRAFKRFGMKLTSKIAGRAARAGVAAVGGAAGAYVGRKIGRKIGGKVLGGWAGAALGTAIGNHLGGYAQDAAVKTTRRQFKKHARTDERVQGRMEYKNVGATISGGAEYIKALNKVHPRQVFGASSPQFGGASAKYQKPKPDYGGTEYDAYGQPLTKVPIAMGGFPYSGFDVNNRGGTLGYERQEPQDFNPPYLGVFSPHVEVA